MKLIKKIDHIGIAVKDLQEVISMFKDGFGLEPTFFEELSDQQVKIAGYQLEASNIEYFEPTSADSPIARFIHKRGNAIHHVAFVVDDLEKAISRLQEKGFEVVDKHPRRGANNTRIAFLHPASFNGILIELCEANS